jgi:hypothetical protein
MNKETNLLSGIFMGVEVTFTPFGVKVYSTDEEKNKRILKYLYDEGFFHSPEPPKESWQT